MIGVKDSKMSPTEIISSLRTSVLVVELLNAKEKASVELVF